MSDYSELKRLAEAATPQKFDTVEDKSGNGYIECPHCGGSGEVELEADYCNYDGAAIGVQFYGIGHEFGAAEAYYRAANPATILALIAENERLGLELKDFQWGASVEAEAGDEARTEVSKLRAEIAGLKTGYQAYELVNAELKAEVGALRKDAERINWLDGQSRPVVEGQCMSNPEGELTGYDWGVFGQCSTVREAIDYAMSAGERP